MADKLNQDGTPPGEGALSPTDFVKLLAEYVSAQTRAESAAGLRRATKARFDKLGAHKPGLDLFLKLRKMEPDDAELTLVCALRYLRWSNSPIGAQLNLFANASDDAPAVAPGAAKALTEAEIYREGFQAGEAGRDATDHRHPVGSEEAQVWAQGWMGGQQALGKRLFAEGGEEVPAGRKPGNRGTRSTGRARRGASNPEDRPAA